MLQFIVNLSKVCSMLVIGLALVAVQPAYAQPAADPVITLPPPQKNTGVPLMEALNKRQSGKKFEGLQPSPQDLSNLLWAAFGVNRTDGRRTAPTAINAKNIIIYVALRTGIWQYEGSDNSLTFVNDKNLTQKFKAPMALLYVAPTVPQDISSMHVGAIFQNVALYCASAGLVCRLQHNLVRDISDTDLTLPDGYTLYITQRISTEPT